MRPYQKEFIEFALELGVLRFGEFTLKSGRVSPYFFNAGLFHSGAGLAQLGRLYAAAIVDAGIEFDLLFGPAYKGIPLATTTAVALADHYNRDMPYAYNRKEKKDHGEGGEVVGAPLQGRVLIIDDVISAGTATRETMSLLEANGARAAGVVVGLNRQERGQGESKLSAIQEIEQAYGIPVISIAAVDHIIAYLEQVGGAEVERIRAYRAQYGV